MGEAVYSPEVTKKLHMEELLRQVRVERSRQASQIGGPFRDLNHDKFHYAWIRNENSSLARASARRYEVVRSEVTKDADTDELQASEGTESSGWLKEDGTHVYGDLILMRCPRDRYEADKLLSALDSQDKLKEAKSREGIMRRGTELGVPVSISEED